MEKVRSVSKTTPCVHCGKHDWCYLLPNGASVCNRDAIADGWLASSKADRNGKAILIPSAWKEKPPKPKAIAKKDWIYRGRTGELLIKVSRTDFDDGSKEIRQFHRSVNRWVRGRGEVLRKDIPIYRYQEIQAAIADEQQIFLVEGEKCADALWELGIPATCNIGGSGQWNDSDSEDLEGANLVLCPDRDKPGMKLMFQIFRVFLDSSWLYVYPDSPLWSNLSDSNGADIADWIEEFNLTAEDIFDAIEPCRDHLLEKEIPDFAPKAELLFTEKAISSIYGQGEYFSLNEELYQYVGTHYKKLSSSTEKRKISDWCRSTPVEVRPGIWRYAYSSSSKVNEIWSWVITRFGIDKDEINPPGLNCLNGVIRLQWHGKEVSYKLVPHDPSQLYTYVSEINYNPSAPTEGCDKLLSALEPPQQKIFLRTMAASLDLATVRKYRGRAVRGLIAKGLGGNGKDALREAMKILYGASLTNVTLTDCQAYDQGRKFPLAKLQGALVSWSSENSSFGQLDSIQCLKAAITGDPIDIEFKNQSEFQINPTTVFLFNCNEVPNLKGGLEAIKSRWGILAFNKTFKVGADPNKGEIEADSRFRYDPEFMQTQVVPALLNKILAELPLLIKEGIDYEPTESDWKAVQQEGNHLWAFCQDAGIQYQVGGKVYINELWEKLQEWYLANGTLQIEVTDKGKEKRIWFDQANPRDKNVTGANQVYKRFSELFPKVTKGRESIAQDRKGQFYLAGIVIFASPASPLYTASDSASPLASPSEADGEAETIGIASSEAGEAKWATSTSPEDLICVMCSRFVTFPPELQHNLINQLNNLMVNPPENSTNDSTFFQKGDRVYHATTKVTGNVTWVSHDGHFIKADWDDGQNVGQSLSTTWINKVT